MLGFAIISPHVHNVLLATAFNIVDGVRAARRPRRRRRMKRQPIRSTKADAKRQAHEYAKDIAGRDISWKKARKLLQRLDREGRASAAAEAALDGAIEPEADA